MLNSMCVSTNKPNLELVGGSLVRNQVCLMCACVLQQERIVRKHEHHLYERNGWEREMSGLDVCHRCSKIRLNTFALGTIYRYMLKPEVCLPHLFLFPRKTACVCFSLSLSVCVCVSIFGVALPVLLVRLPHSVLTFLCSCCMHWFSVLL